jgi:DNA processing protein
LIKDGATIVTAIDDVISEVRPMLGRAPASVSEREREPVAHDADDSDRQQIVSAMGAAPVELDEIIRFTGLSPAIVRLVLIELDLAGRIEHHPGGRVSLIG